MRQFFDSLFPTKRPVLQYRANRTTQIIDNPETASQFFRRVWDPVLIETQEQFYAVFLDEENIPINFQCLQTGGFSNLTLDFRLLFKHAVLSGCHGMIIAHNHPNGSLKPSQFDKKTTQMVVDLCKLHGFHLNDHIIMTKKSYFSFLEGGIINP